VRQRRPIPIAIVLTSFDSGGSEHQMTELVRRLDPRLFTVHVATLRGRGALRARVEAAAASITEFPLPSFKSPTAFRQLGRFASWCRGRGVQVVLTCDFYANVFALPGAALAGVPVRLGARRDVFMPERSSAQQRLQRLAYLFAHRVVANSGAAAERLIEEGIADWRVVRIANGIDIARFETRAPTNRRRVITMVANLRPGKGHEVLLRAAARMLRRIPDLRFQIVGDGPRRAELEREAAALRVSAQVEFLGHRADVPQILRDSDVFAFPSFMEASPNAVLEAMAAGLPIVATRVGGIPEVIEHERNGLLVEPGDAEQLSRALELLLADGDLRRRLGAAGRAKAERRFDVRRNAEELQGLLMDGTRRPGVRSGADRVPVV
jgi:glycosyltransferase involved in cell wall biosynthesis